jgi:hypothetical protein
VLAGLRNETHNRQTSRFCPSCPAADASRALVAAGHTGSRCLPAPLRLTHKEIIVETYRNPGEPSSRPVRVRPLPGQAFSENYRVWCSLEMRRSKPVGSLFRVPVSVVHQLRGDSYLRIGLYDTWVPITLEEAKRFIDKNAR